MKKSVGSHYVVALDIGTTKICALVAQQAPDKSIDILGIGKAPSTGVSRGVVVDIAQAVHAIKAALKEAELMSGCRIESVNVGISGAHIHALSSQGMVPIKQGKITKQDIAAVIQSAQAVMIPEGQQVLHVIPQYYVIDGQERLTDPLGMHGVRLEAKVHIITGSIASVQNIISCCQMAGVQVDDIILEPLASAEAVLSADERNLGVALLDIGGGTSDFAIYHQGAICYTKVFPVAGNHVTSDLALCLRTTLRDAERIKREYGRTTKDSIDILQHIQVEMVHGGEFKAVLLDDVITIIEPRIHEMLMLVRREIELHDLSHLMPAGLVITGGGALLQGLQATATRIVQVPVRIGHPQVPHQFKHALESPSYATSYGLLMYMFKKDELGIEALQGPLMHRVFWKMKSWISDFF